MTEKQLTVIDSLKEAPKFVVPEDLFKSDKLEISSDLCKETPQPLPELGYTEDLNLTKNKITPHAEKWERIKFLISDFELIDIFRPPRISKCRYNEPIIKYRFKTDPDETKGRYPIFSRAYFKLWETLSISKVLDRYQGQPLTVANVAEGPGGFIHCLIDFRKLQNGLDWNKDSYHGITLRIVGDRSGQALDWDWPRAKEYFQYAKQNHQITLSYGGDDSGNMLKLINLQHYIEKDLGKKKCQLVTGDGGIGLGNDDEYGKQEIANSLLFYAEILYAFHVQEVSGCFILKIYDIYYEVTVQLILLLKLFYEKVTIIKPHTSRPASSEKYLVCEEFKGISEEKLELMRQLLEQWVEKSGALKSGLDNQKFTTKIFDFDPNEDKVKELINNIREFNQPLCDSQIYNIEKGLNFALKDKVTTEEIIAVKKRQKEIAIVWCERYKVPYREDLDIEFNPWEGDNANGNNKHQQNWRRDTGRDFHNNHTDYKSKKFDNYSSDKYASNNRDRSDYKRDESKNHRDHKDRDQSKDRKKSKDRNRSKERDRSKDRDSRRDKKEHKHKRKYSSSRSRSRSRSASQSHRKERRGRSRSPRREKSGNHHEDSHKRNKGHEGKKTSKSSDMRDRIEKD